MNEIASKEPSNKKADDDAICQFVAEHETGVIAPEVAEAFATGKTTAREALGRLEDAGQLSTRTAGSTIKLYYVEDDAAETAETVSSEADSSGNVFGSVAFPTDAQRTYLRDGTLDGETEPALLDRLREHFAETLWQTPCLDGFDREEIELIARRLGIPSGEVSSLTPNDVFERLDELAVALRTDIDRLYHPNRIPSLDVLCRVRREHLDQTQHEIATRLAEVDDLSQSSYEVRLSQWESGAGTISEEDRARLATIYRDLYKDNHDPYQLRDDLDWTTHHDSDSDTDSNWDANSDDPVFESQHGDSCSSEQPESQGDQV